MDRSEFHLLLTRVRAWEPDAVDTFLARFGGEVRREIRIRLTDPRLKIAYAESDVCQSIVFDFLLRLAAGQYDFDDSTEVLRFLVAATANKIRNIARKEKSARRDVRLRAGLGDQALALAHDGQASPSSIVASRQLLDHVLDRLSPEDRYLAVQRGQERTWEDLALELSTTPDALRKQFKRALDKVLERLHPDNLDP